MPDYICTQVTLHLSTNHRKWTDIVGAKGQKCYRDPELSHLLKGPKYKTMTSLPYLQEVSQQIFQIGREMRREANLTRDKY